MKKIMLSLVALLLLLATTQTNSVNVAASVTRSLDLSHASLITHSDGSVTAGFCGPISTYDNSLSPVQLVQVPGYQTCLDPANNASFVDKQGVLFTTAGSTAPNDSNQHILAFNRDGGLRWVADPPSQDIIGLVLGSNGKVYGIGSDFSGSNQYLFGYDSGTQPTIVLNKQITAGEKQVRRLASFYGGLAVLYGNRQIQYFGYDGSLISTVTVQNIWNQEFFVANNGQFFMPIVPASTQFCPQQAMPTFDAIQAFSPYGVLWSYKLPACSTTYTIKPTPDGGFVALVSQDDGLVKRRFLLSVKGDGSFRWQTDLPMTENGNSYPSPSTIVSANGDIVVVSQYTRSDNNRGVTTSVLGGLTGQAWFNHNFEPSIETGGFVLDHGDASFAITNGRAYLSLKPCRYSTNGGAPDCGGYASLNQVDIPGMTVEYPRGAMFAFDQPMRKYYALGDSFSSGEGVEPFIYGTDTAGPPLNRCHRSGFAYPKLLAENPAMRVVMLEKNFVACSGAETKHILSVTQYQNSQDPQVDYLLRSGDAQIVTISIGGNDIMFKEFTTQCLFLDCSQPTVKNMFFEKIQNMGASLDAVYHRILQVAPNAKVYVIGYPQLLPSTGCSQTDGWMQAFDAVAAKAKQGDAAAIAAIQAIGSSAGLTDAQIAQLISAGTVQFSLAEVETARELVSQLDAKIKATVGNAQPNLLYVDPLAPGSPFIGHELCTTQPYFNGLVINPTGTEFNVPFSFHPNYLGHANGYVQLLKPVLI